MASARLNRLSLVQGRHASVTWAGGLFDLRRGGQPTLVWARAAYDRPAAAQDGPEATSQRFVGSGRWRRSAVALAVRLVRRVPAATRARTPGDASPAASGRPEAGAGTAIEGRQVKPLVPIGANGRTPRAVLVAVIGLPDEQLDAAIDAALADGHPDGVFPVFLTDSCAFGKFVRRRVLFEHHPPRDCRSRTIGSLDWDLYERRRLQLLLTKWRPLRVIAFGAEARARLDEWQTGIV